MKARVSNINIPSVNWKKYVVKRGREIVSPVFYSRKEATAYRDLVNKD